MTGAPARRLGLPTATALVVANMIGAGVFTTSGFTLAALGTPERVIQAWIVGGIIAVLGAVSYGALARRISESGGEYVFLSQTIHPFAGRVAGWMSLFAGFTAPIALAALTIDEYLPVVDSKLPILGTIAIVAATAIHGVRLAHGARAQNAVVAFKLALLVLLVGYGVAQLPDLAPPSDAKAFEAPTFAIQLVYISLAYSGWNAAVYIGGEVKNPDRNLPRSMLLGTVIVMVAYVALNAVFVYAAPVEQLAKRPDVAAVAARALGGGGFETFVRIIIAIALFTSISAMVMAGPRVYARMAEDGVLPAVFSRRGDVPGMAVALQAALAIVVLWIATLRELLGYLGFTLSLGTAATVIGLMRLRRKEGAARVPVPGYPFVPLLFLVATLGAGAFWLFGDNWKAQLASLGTLLVAALLSKQRDRTRST